MSDLEPGEEMNTLNGSIARTFLLILILVSTIITVTGSQSDVVTRRAVVLELDMNIDGGAVSFIETYTERYRGYVFVLVINSYGGYLSSADRIITAIERSGGECIAWIPPGGYAVSAAAYIAIYCSRIYMGPGSVIGGIKPSPDDPKVVEYIKARLLSFLERKNITGARELVDEMVDKAKTYTASEAISLRLAYPASNINDVLGQESLEVVEQAEPGLWDKLLSLISHPLISEILLFAGIILILVEIFTTGFQGYAVAGATMILLALYGLTLIPVDLLLLGLIVSGAILLGVEALTPGFGLFGISGSVLTLLGFTLTLTRTPPETLTGLVVSVAFGVSLIAGLFIFIGVKAAKAMRMKRISIQERLIGSIGIAKTDISETEPGVVYLLNEDWTALSSRGFISAGSKVRVVRADGLKLIVEKAEE